MKAKILIIWLAVTLSANFVSAQDSKFGDDPDRCRAELSTYDQFFKQESFKDAYPAWSWCFKNCPKSTKNIYIQGPDILEHMIENSEGDKKEAFIDTLLMIYDKRTEHFGNKGKNLGKKAVKIMKYRSNKAKLAFKYFKEAVELEGNETSVNVLGRYMQLSTVLVNNKLIEANELLKTYSKISEIINYKIENGNKGAERAKEQIDGMLVNSGVLDCEKMTEVFEPMFEKNKDNLEMLKTIQNIMKKEECFKSELYDKVIEQMYKLDQSSSAAHILAQFFFKKNQSKKSEKYYKEAIKLQQDSSKKADLYFELGLLYFNQMDQYSAARKYARKAISIDSEYGKAYKLIGKIYAEIASDCGENDFEHSTVYWAVVDKLLKARSVSPELSEELTPMISKYRALFPTKEDYFFHGLEKDRNMKLIAG